MSEPTTSKWDLALDGISQLEGKIDAMMQTQHAMQEQINGLRHSYTRAAPMLLLQSLELRVSTLETGATAQILARLDADVLTRQTRQAQRDRFDAWRVVVLACLVVVILVLVGVVIWAELRP